MKIFSIIFLFITTLFAKEVNHEIKLYEVIMPIIFQKEKIIVYTDKEYSELLESSLIFKVSSNCHEVDFLLGKYLQNLDIECKNKPQFSISYKSYEKSPNSFGVFYWSKNRPEILFNLKRINKFKLYLPNSLKKYTTKL